MKQFMWDFLKNEEGLTMVEYAIAGALVAGTAVLVFTNLGTAIVAAITKLTTAVNS
ncbi:MAG TPA: Flp family type IVb pilin [Steroidobacteraceae bacterium]